MARFHRLSAGYGGGRVASTVSLVESGSSLVVIDSGMVASTSVILDPIRELGRAPEEVTGVVISHHHSDHTINIALFRNVKRSFSWGTGALV